MVTRQSKVTGFAFVLLALIIGAGVWFSCSDSRQARAEQPKDTKLKKLLKERHLTLQDTARLTLKGYQSGEVPLERLHEVVLAVHRAEFDLCDTDKERTAVLENIVAMTKKQEEDALKAFRSGAVAGSVSLKAKVNRLEAEIALERAKNK